MLRALSGICVLALLSGCAAVGVATFGALVGTPDSRGLIRGGSGPSAPDPFLSHWIKNDMTKESRRNDSWACGALPTTYAADHAMVTEGKYQGGEMDLRLSKQWVACMKSKGYVHLEKCDARCLYP